MTILSSGTPTTSDGAAGCLPVLETALAFYASRALMSAVELDLFTLLADRPLTRAEVEAAAGLHPRVSSDFLDALVALGLLERADGRYTVGELAGRHLVRGRGTYVGGFAAMSGASLYPVWARLTELLRTGEPQIPRGGGFFGALYQDPGAAHVFMDAMDTFNDEIATVLLSCGDWSGVRSVVDVGGARGDLAVRLARAVPDLDAVCLDLPPVRALFDERTGAGDVADRVSFLAGDFVTDPWPEADVYVFGHILHGQDVARRRELLGRAFRGLRPGGTLFVIDRMIDDGRRERPLSLLGSVGMALVSPVGSEYTAAECRGWMAEAGFTDLADRPIAATDTLAVGRRPGDPVPE